MIQKHKKYDVAEQGFEADYEHNFLLLKQDSPVTIHSHAFDFHF